MGKARPKLVFKASKVVPGSIYSPQNSIYRWQNNEQPLSQGIQIVVRLISWVVPKSKNHNGQYLAGFLLHVQNFHQTKELLQNIENKAINNPKPLPMVVPPKQVIE
eukprot:TRINITY_DN14907_c1_g1_i1.p1 TRINITY_DN14907_c1_g1~~TRINITY_DN14907_c1_g1_i1.p1  ORF type:complete len:106 (+),score=8.05 TRINITY_DN14907_c1_g1_i1:882-1199(+)